MFFQARLLTSRAYARVQHQGAGRQACPVEQLFRGVEKPFCLVQGKGPHAFFPEDGGRNQKGRVSAAPPALQGKISGCRSGSAAPCAAGGEWKSFCGDNAGTLPRDGTDLFFCQFRAFFHHPGSHIADFLQGAGPAVFFSLPGWRGQPGKTARLFPCRQGPLLPAVCIVWPGLFLSPLPRLVSRRSFRRRKASMGGMPRERRRRIPV